MAGKMCPNCGEYTFFSSVYGRKCSRCGYEMILATNDGKGGKGKRCVNCGKFTVFNDKCRNCGASYRMPGKTT